MTIPKWTPVVVRWVDAHTDYDETSSADYVIWKKQIRKSIGWLIHWDKERVVIAMEDDRESNGSTDAQTVTTIPSAMILNGPQILAPQRIPRKK